jgi:hypothetical protein
MTVSVKPIMPFRWIFIGIIALFTVLIVQNLQAPNGRDTDVLVRFAQSLELYRTHDWYNHTTYRISAPEGVFIHWTRPLDVLLLLAALPVSLFVPLHTAILWSAAFLVPCFFLATFYLFYKIIQLLPLGRYGVPFALLVYATNPYLYVVFAPANVDTNFILHSCSIVVMCGLMRAVNNANKAVLLIALGCGMGIWISPEFLVFTAVSLTVLAVLWLQHPQRYAVTLWRVPLGMTGVLSVAMVLERSPVLAVVHDSVSIVHVTLFGCITTLSFLLAHVTHPAKSLRFALAITAAVVLFGMMEFLFPNFHRAHYNHVTPLVQQYKLAKIGELESLYQPDNPLHCLGTIVFLLVGMGSVVYRLFKRDVPETWLCILGFVATVYTCFALYQIRWLPYALPWMGVFAAPVVERLLSRTSVYFQQRFQHIKMLDCAFIAQTLLFIALVFAGFIVQVAGAETSKSPTPQEQALEQCIEELEQRIVNNAFADLQRTPAPLTLMMPTRYAGAMLFYTPHSVVAGNYHRDALGIPDVHDFFNAETVNAAKNILNKRHVDAVVYCEGQELDTGKTIADVPFLHAVQQGKNAAWYTIMPQQAGESPLLKRVLIKSLSRN